MPDRPFIVSLAMPEDEFRGQLADRLPGARILRAMSGGRLVVLLPPGSVDELAGLPGVRAVTPDERRLPTGRGQRD